MLAVFDSFNPKAYKEIIKKKFGVSLGFLVIFIMILSAVIALKYNGIVRGFLPKVSSWSQTNLSSIFSDLPRIEIKDGRLVSPADYYIKKWGNEFSLIIEPEEEKVFSLIKDYPNALVLTDTKLIAKYSRQDSRGQSEIKMYDLDDIEYLNLMPIDNGVRVSVKESSFEVTPQFIDSLVNRFSVFIYPFIFLWFTFIYSINKVIQLFFFSLLSMIFRNKLNRKLSYNQLLTIGIYAMVPPTVLAVLLEISRIHLPGMGIIYLGVYIFYLFRGVKAADIKSSAAQAEVKAGG